LQSYLAQRQLSLILDNCEHLIERCAELVWTLIQRCGGVRVMATSREPLGIEGELVWRLKPLEVEEAAQLFLERARAHHSTTFIEDMPSVLQLCRRLDGLPLAVELAAARAGVLAPAEMLAHLEDRFALLRRTSRGTAMRHHTLRATIDCSYDLLESSEQQLFRRLAVFSGGFDLTAGSAMGVEGTLDVLERLIDKSLVQAERHALSIARDAPTICLAATGGSARGRFRSCTPSGVLPEAGRDPVLASARYGWSALGARWRN
jgi:predicted ATPase